MLPVVVLFVQHRRRWYDWWPWRLQDDRLKFIYGSLIFVPMTTGLLSSAASTGGRGFDRAQPEWRIIKILPFIAVVIFVRVTVRRFAWLRFQSFSGGVQRIGVKFDYYFQIVCSFADAIAG